MFALEQATKAQGESMGIAPRPGRFTPEQDSRYPLYWRPGGPEGPSGRVRKFSTTSGFDSWTVQPVASCYTDYPTPAHIKTHCRTKVSNW